MIWLIVSKRQWQMITSWRIYAQTIALPTEILITDQLPNMDNIKT
jgi:hypothetical protein